MSDIALNNEPKTRSVDLKNDVGEFEIDFDSPSLDRSEAPATALQRNELFQEGFQLLTESNYGLAKRRFKEALDVSSRMPAPPNVDRAMELAAASTSTLSRTQIPATKDVDVAKLHASLALTNFYQWIDAKKALTSHQFRRRHSVVSQPEVASSRAIEGVILQRRHDRLLMEAYEAALRAVDACPSDWEPESEKIERLRRLSRTFWFPDDVLVFDDGDDEPIRIENAKKLSRKFLAFHHSMRN